MAGVEVDDGGSRAVTKRVLPPLVSVLCHPSSMRTRRMPTVL